MKLISVQVKNFRNILDSSEVKIQPDVTCLVGKNESGKSAFLQALHRLNPAQKNVSFSIPDQYPAWLEKRHRRAGRLEDFCPVMAVFRLEEGEVEAAEAEFGKGILISHDITMTRQYDGHLLFKYDVDERVALQTILDRVELPTEPAKPTTLDELQGFMETLKGQSDNPQAQSAAAALDKVRSEILGPKASLRVALDELLEEMAPKFFYYADYSRLPGSVKIRELLAADKSRLDDNQLTARALLELAGAENDYLLNPDYERRKRELENVANALTDDILEYWSTNRELRAVIDISQRTEQYGNGQHTVLDEMKVRLWDNRHSLSLPFDERSSGFRWFFSFLAAFSAYERDELPVIVLLDEPGLGLHARGQRDLLRFIDERLSKAQQVVFTTHSPFMVQPDHLERVRLVEDLGREKGSTVSSDALATDPDTLFPLQGALGYDLAQHLFVAPHNLVVEGTSDFTYLTILSRHLTDLGREGLSENWSVIPVGGADTVPTFVALLGHHLEITVLVDSQKAGHQRLEKMADQGLLARNRILMVGKVLGRTLADIEDVFAVEDYLTLFKAAFGEKVAVRDLTGNDPILARLERVRGAKFDHGKPADVLLRRRDEFLPGFRPETLDNFETLFRTVNATLPK